MLEKNWKIDILGTSFYLTLMSGESEALEVSTFMISEGLALDIISRTSCDVVKHDAKL